MENRIDYEERADLLKALSHPVRLQIVHGLLSAGCRNVRCIESHVGMSQSCISQHLQKLRAAGNEVYYRALSGEVAGLVAALMGEEVQGYVL